VEDHLHVLGGLWGLVLLAVFRCVVEISDKLVEINSAVVILIYTLEQRPQLLVCQVGVTPPQKGTHLFEVQNAISSTVVLLELCLQLL